MNTVTAPPPGEPNPGYWHQLAEERLALQPGLKPGDGATVSEQQLWSRLVSLQAAAYAVLSDIDDDGVAEAQDMAILGLREAVKSPEATRKVGPGGRVIFGAVARRRRIATK